MSRRAVARSAAWAGALLSALLSASVVMSVPAQAGEVTLAPSTCGKVTQNQDGTVSPVICPNGHPNARVWAAITSGTPHLAALGARPTWRQVRAAACADVPEASYPIVTDSYQWLATRYEWLRAGLPGAENFGDRLVNGMCDRPAARS